MKTFLLTALLAIFSLQLTAQDKPYNENQNPRDDIRKAVAKAQTENKNVLIQFGGNWCPWCLRFHKLVNTVPALDSLIKENYIYVLANVPHEKEKRDYTLFEEYQFPNRFGYPVFVILDRDGRKIHVQDSDAFEHPNPALKGYDTTKVKRFLSMWTPAAIDPKTYQLKK